MLADAAKDGYIPRRVYVGGMPYHYDESMLREYWGYCGEIEGMDIMTFPDSGRFKGIAFITYKTQARAVHASHRRRNTISWGEHLFIVCASPWHFNVSLKGVVTAVKSCSAIQAKAKDPV